MALSKSVVRAIEEVVRRQIDMVPIAEVAVREGEDHDGDPSLFVRVVFDADVDDLDARRTVGLNRHLRERLGDLGETRFPYTTFISKEDAEAA